jgi:hypothetical protein
LNKKWLLRAMVAVAVGIVSLLIAVPVLAPWGYCDTDPVLSINGHTVNLDAAIQGDPSALSGATFHVNAPAGTQIDVISVDPGAVLKINCNNGNNQSIKVSVDFQTSSEYSAIFSVSVDGQTVAQSSGTTLEELSASFSAS